MWTPANACTVEARDGLVHVVPRNLPSYRPRDGNVCHIRLHLIKVSVYWRPANVATTNPQVASTVRIDRALRPPGDPGPFTKDLLVATFAGARAEAASSLVLPHTFAGQRTGEEWYVGGNARFKPKQRWTDKFDQEQIAAAAASYMPDWPSGAFPGVVTVERTPSSAPASPRLSFVPPGSKNATAAAAAAAAKA